MKYRVTLATTATMRGEVTVEAESREAAMEKAWSMADQDLVPDWEIEDVDLGDAEVYEIAEVKSGDEAENQAMAIQGDER